MDIEKKDLDTYLIIGILIQNKPNFFKRIYEEQLFAKFNFH